MTGGCGGTVTGYFSDLHGERARWRTARKAQVCGERWLPPFEATHEIAAGERYFDTGDVVASPFVTTKLCERHANEPRAI